MAELGKEAGSAAEAGAANESGTVPAGGNVAAQAAGAPPEAGATPESGGAAQGAGVARRDAAAGQAWTASEPADAGVVSAAPGGRGGVVLEMIGIDKQFPGVKALDNVQLTLRSGTVHSLMGENGAGKSTL
ncbi:MAG: ATP-binding cassette domain-containing protein, partial [Clostridiales bacterium]|nr:ATP-binding cassette domain-containing protein [Clostridiales bacterium]